ncbi:hypothetical protein NPIL_350961 [Nephila pilipes]|uniref:Uncharacterized protein n=1 Tax=Nephila pilipes TaxID=299642 RepID=A0A8X6KP95_NEPPI|nr:hypothetical protein NPIL_350961 [Nephila pilipes]
MAPRDIESDKGDDWFCPHTRRCFTLLDFRIREIFLVVFLVKHQKALLSKETEDEEEDCKRQSGRERTPSGQPRTQIR